MSSILRKHACALSLAVALSACGGGGGNAGGSGGGGDAGGGTPPPPDYSRHYQGLGLAPAGQAANLHVDEAVADAVRPGYLAFASMMAVLDLRMGLQAFEWYLPQAASTVGDISAAGTAEAPYPDRAAVPCAPPLGQEGEAAIFHWHDADGDGSLSPGEELRFGFGNCVASYGAARFTSDGAGVAQPRVQRYTRLARGDAPLAHRFELTGVGIDLYPGFTVNSGPLVRYPEPGETLRQAFSNAAEDGVPGTVEFAGESAVGPVRVRVRGSDRGVTAPSVVVTEKMVEHYLLLTIPHFDIHLEIGGDVESRWEGGYVLSTEGITEILYEGGLALTRGTLRVQAPDGAVYSYTADPDPAYLTVTIDRDGDGQAEASGRMSQGLMIGRLRLER